MKTETRKIIVVGVDGMDARLSKKYMDAGKMPNLKKLLEHGSARDDLVMLGGHPTVTPPMWTTSSARCRATAGSSTPPSASSATTT